MAGEVTKYADEIKEGMIIVRNDVYGAEDPDCATVTGVGQSYEDEVMIEFDDGEEYNAPLLHQFTVIEG